MEMSARFVLVGVSHSALSGRHANDGHEQATEERPAMTENDLLVQEFERNRGRLRAVAYRMLGSINDADDAVQEAWLRLSRSDSDTIANLPRWLTAVVARVSLDMLKARRSRREEYVGSWLPEPVVVVDEGETVPEDEALLADSVGLALLVVLDSLAPSERLAFVLHDMFAVPFDEIAQIVGATPAAARQLASRARRRVRGAAPAEDADLAQQRELVDAFLAASREGSFEGLIAVLDPDAVFRVDAGGRGPQARGPVTGAEAVARQILSRGRPFARFARPAVVNGRAGVVVSPGGIPMAVVGFTTAGGRIVAIDLIIDREKLRHLALGGQED
jgi:RNA polymerase sigma-70 factor (ECF subfamily)